VVRFTGERKRKTERLVTRKSIGSSHQTLQSDPQDPLSHFPIFFSTAGCTCTSTPRVHIHSREHWAGGERFGCWEDTVASGTTRPRQDVPGTVVGRHVEERRNIPKISLSSPLNFLVYFLPGTSRSSFRPPFKTWYSVLEYMLPTPHKTGAIFTPFPLFRSLKKSQSPLIVFLL